MSTYQIRLNTYIFTMSILNRETGEQDKREASHNVNM